eukprot:COSAG02_NODE_2672_length_8274_cov_3.014537_3_plen_181_part_00
MLGEASRKCVFFEFSTLRWCAQHHGTSQQKSALKRRLLEKHKHAGMLQRTYLVLATAAWVACVIRLVLAAGLAILVDGISALASPRPPIRFGAIGRSPTDGTTVTRPRRVDGGSLYGPTYVQEPEAPTAAHASLVRPVAVDSLGKAAGQATTNGVHVLSLASALYIHQPARVSELQRAAE